MLDTVPLQKVYFWSRGATCPKKDGIGVQRHVLSIAMCCVLRQRPEHSGQRTQVAQLPQDLRSSEIIWDHLRWHCRHHLSWQKRCRSIQLILYFTRAPENVAELFPRYVFLCVSAPQWQWPGKKERTWRVHSVIQCQVDVGATTDSNKPLTEVEQKWWPLCKAKRVLKMPILQKCLSFVQHLHRSCTFKILYNK